MSAVLRSMVGGLLAVLLRLSRIGTDGLSENDARRVLMSNAVALSVIASHLQFSLMHLAHAPWAHLPVVLALLASCAVLAFAIWLNHRRQPIAASVLMALDVTAVLLQNDWYLGNALGARYFFFAAIPAIFLMLPPTSWRLIGLLITLFASSYMLSQFLFDEAQIVTHDDFITAYRVLCSLSTFAMLGLFFWLFYRETRRLEGMREQAARQLDTAREAAEAATEAKSQFLARMSHEIRTPMNAVVGFTELALRSDDKARRNDYLARIREASQSLLGLINDILDLSRIEAGRLTLNPRDFQLRELIDKLSGLFSAQTASKSLLLQLHAPPALPPLHGDPLRLEQVLINLLNNAIKFTERGEVELCITPLAQTAQAIELQFCVRDTGVGIAGDVAARLFTAFSQGDESITRRYGGSGLGLVICKQLVELMGGRLWLESEPGRGSRFYFTARFTPGLAASPAAARAPTTPDALQGLRLLLVEDNVLNQMLASDLLRGYGATVEVAGDGEQAITAVGLNPYDLVLMDVQMPVMDGLEATRWIRSNAHHRDLPIIAMTANAMDSDRQRCLDAGMNDFIPKPIDIEQMLAVIGKWRP